MKKHDKEVLQSRLDAEEKELKRLKAIYNKAADDIMKKIEISNGKISVLLANWDDLTDEEKSIYQSQIYQRNFQKSLKTQIDGFLKDLNSKQYTTMTEYMEDCYKNGYLGAMYSIHKQGIPIISPIDQKKVTKAMFTDSKISKKLYTKLGEDVEVLKKRIANNLSRGIATASDYKVIARNIAADSNVGFNRAMRITRTEGNRISNESAYDASMSAKDKGADVVKSWDAALDKRTRDSHRQVDGEIRELDEKFSNGMMYPSDPAGGASEVVNCRCALLQRARWALDDDELETLKERAKYYGLDKTDSFNDFRRKYLPAAEEVNIMPAGFAPAKTIKEATKVANDLGVKYAIYDDLPIGTANLFNEALMTLPKDARPVFVGSSKMLEQYRHAKLPRSSKNFYGVSIETDGIFLGTDASKAGAVKAFWDYDTYGNMVAISSYYKTADKITKAKEIAQESYMKKHGRKWFFNVDGHATPFHEMGHAYAGRYGLSDDFIRDAARWAEESGCDMIKKPSEAWAEAWAAYHIKNPDLPDYIKKHIEKAIKYSGINAQKAGKALNSFDSDSIIDGKILAFKQKFKNNEVRTIISQQKQARHIKGTKEFERYVAKMAVRGDYPSYIKEELSLDDLKNIIVPKLTGNVGIGRDGSYREFITLDDAIGYYYDKSKGKYVETKCVQIKYALGDGNIHIVPVKEL